MRKLAIILMILWTVSASAQSKVHHVVVDKNATATERYAATQLREFLYKGQLGTDTVAKKEGTVYVGDTKYLRKYFAKCIDSLRDDGYLICGDGRNLCLYGAGEKGTLYAVYAYLEKIGYRCYTPTDLVIPDIFGTEVPVCNEVSNPAFAYREVSYYYPNHSQLYADWHHLHTEADRDKMFGMFVHTFKDLIPPARYFEAHPEWFSLNSGRRSRDGQLCLSNPAVLEELCCRLADTMATAPEKKMWSVSNNDNYNACQCPECLHMDSLYGGPTGTLLHFVNQVARRFPDKTISTLAYQYTRCAPTNPAVKPEKNVNIMFCSIECGRELPIADNPREASFRKDMEDWARLTDNIFMWDYVVQFRNFWNPFPNLHVLQPNLQFFHKNGVRMMFEQATGADNVTSWMDIRCYMLAKLLWNPDVDIDSIMADFYQGYYKGAGPYIKEIIDTMTSVLIQSGQRLDIYGYPVDAVDGYLSLERFHQYDSLIDLAYMHAPEYYVGCFQVPDTAMWFFCTALDFARNELAVSRDLCGYFSLDSLSSDPDWFEREVIDRLEIFGRSTHNLGIPQLMEMGVTPGECIVSWTDNIRKRFGENKARYKSVTFRHPATVPYNTTGLTDGKAGILDYRHDWLGFWGDTLDAVIDLGEATEIKSISLDFYFYPLSWIFLPQRIEFQESVDSNNWRTLEVFSSENPMILATPSIKTFTATTKGSVRYIRVVAEPLPEIPAWHRAAGQKPWLFTDEIIIK